MRRCTPRILTYPDIQRRIREERAAEAIAAQRIPPRKANAALPLYDGQIFLNCSFSLSGAVEAREGGQPKPPTLDIDAYNGGPMNISGYRLPVVVDIAGIERLGDAIPVLRDHDPKRAIGHGKAFAAANRLRMTGVLSFDNADALEVAASFAKGFPWQASIGLMPSRVEEVRAGQLGFANGMNREGPLLIVRAGKLREVSILALGADDSTSARVAAMLAEE